MIKDLVLKYKDVAFLCNSKQEFVDFIECATKEIIFSKTGYEEDKDYILNNYFNAEFYSYSKNKIAKKGYEFQFYARNYEHWTNPNKYGGEGLHWEKFTIIDVTKFLRKQKLQKLNEST